MRNYRNRNRRDRVSEALRECESLWVLRWLPRTKIDDMVAEMEVDLIVAEEHGWSFERVMGTKRVYRFAEVRADAHQEPEPSAYLAVEDSVEAVRFKPSLRFRLLTWAYPFVLAAALVLLPQHVFFSSVEFSLTQNMLIAALSVAVAVKLFRWPWLAARSWNRLRRSRFIRPEYYAPFFVGLAASPFLTIRDPHPSDVVASWPWPASLVLVACYIACERAVAERDPTATPTSPVTASSTEQPDHKQARSYVRSHSAVMIVSFFGLALAWWFSTGPLHELYGFAVVLSAYILVLLLPRRSRSHA